MKEAQLYIRLKNQQVHCELCAHSCIIPEGKFGFCQVRQNVAGILYTHNYGKLLAMNVDPIEKKPLFHFLPGSTTFSIAGAGCNFRCGFCQNWEISQNASGRQAWGDDFTALQIVELAQAHNCRSIAYTYTEPTVNFEFVLETAQLAHTAGLKNIFVTNGYASSKAIALIAPYLDAANIDLKFFKQSSYQRIASAQLAPVLEGIQLFKAAGIWVEVTTLVIPGANDTAEELTEIAKFIALVDKDIPWHISRFHPDYKFNNYSPTPESTLQLANDLGIKQGLHYVYIGNVGGQGEDTFCVKCRKLLIKRQGFNVLESHLTQNRCSFCQNPLPGVFS